ncbi:MAG: hypothetical protein LBK47_10000 [Prevotellaceae bacterium]|jgi:hypothetical protein|nr:hypothetical protein [Prevotellaceae bacterium]
MKQKIILLSLVALGVLLGATCIKNMGAFGRSLDEMAVYIDGDSGKVVTITHLTSNAKGSPSYPNVEVTREVSLPFAENITTDCWSSGKQDYNYLKVATSGDFEVRVVVFSGGLATMPHDTICDVGRILFQDLDYYIYIDDVPCYKCGSIYESCRSYSKDSVYAFLEDIKYPAYKVMKKGDTYLEIDFYKVVAGWRNPYFVSDTAR